MGLLAGAVKVIGAVGGLVMGFAGSRMEAEGHRQAAEAEARNLIRRAQIAEMNVGFAKQEAEHERKKGLHTIGMITLKGGQIREKQRAAYAANLADITEGSAAEAQASSSLLETTDVNTARENAIRSAWGHEVRATNFAEEAQALRQSAASINPGAVARASMLGGASRLLGGISSLMGMF